MLYSTAVLEVRTRLMELAADFWQPDELLRAVNEGVNRFAQEEKWPYLFTIEDSVDLAADSESLELQDGVSYERHFNLLLTFAGEDRPRAPRRVGPAEGNRLRLTYYQSSAEPLAYYIASQRSSGADEVQSVANTGTTVGTFTLTFDGQTTAVISRGATAAVVEGALKALSNIGPADVHCYGGPLGSSIVYVRFQRTLGGANVPTLVLGGTTVNMAVATPTTGGAGSGNYVPAVRFVPVVNRDATVEYQYVRDPVTPLYGDDLTLSHLDVPEEYAMAVCAYATGHALLKELDYSRKAEEQFSLYGKVVDDARRELRKLMADITTFAWGRNSPEYGFIDESWFTEMVTPPLLGS